MKAGKILTIAALVASVGFVGEIQVEKTGGDGPGIFFGVTQASAGHIANHGAVRRTARRTTRRTVRRLSALPAGCPLVGLYYYCGGVYYQSVVEAGQTVYIVVTP